MKLTLTPFVAARLAYDLPPCRADWELLFTSLAGPIVELPHFFWEVECRFLWQQVPLELTLHLTWPTGWEPVVYDTHLESIVQRRILRGLYSRYGRENHVPDAA